MNAQQVARELGVTERTVRRWVQRGQLQAERSGRQLVIDIEAARAISSPRAARELDELRELRGLRERYAELERRYDQLLRILDPHHRRNGDG